MRWLVIFLSTAIVLVSTLLIVLLLKKPLQVGRTFVWSNCVVFSLSISTKKLTISEILVDIKCKKKTLQVHLNDVKFVFAKWSIRCQVGNFFLHGTCENGKKEERKKKAVFFSDPSKKGKKSSDDASNRGKKLLFCVAKLFLFMLSLIDVHIERCHLLLQKSMQQGGKQCADENETTEEKRDRQKDSTDGATKQRRKENFITAAIEAVLSNVHITKNRKIETISSFFDLEKISIFCNDRSACTISSGSFRTCYDHQLRSVSVEGVFILRIYFYLNCLYELVFFFFSTNNVYCEGGSKKWKTSPQLCNRLGNFINRVTLHMEMVKLYMKEKDTTPFLCILTDDLSLEKEGTPNLVRSRVKRLHLLSVEGGRCYVSTAYDVSACVEVGPSGRSGNNGSDLSAFTQGGSTHGEVARPTNNFTSADAKLKIQIDCEKLFMNLCSVWPLIYFNFVKNFFDLFQVAKEKDRSAKLPRREGQDGRYKGGATPNGGEDNEGATYPHNANSSDERKKGKCKMKGEKERSAANKKNFTLNLCANDICCKFRNSGNLVVIDLDPLDEGFAKTFVLTSNRFNLHLEKRSFLLALQNVEVFNSNGRFTCLVHNFTICKTHREYFFEAKNVFFYFPPMELLTVGVVNFALECLREASHSTFLRVLSATLKIVVSKNVVYVISEQTTLCGRNFTLACDYLNVCNEKKESNFTFIRLDTPTVSSTFDDHFLELLNEVHRVVRFISILVKRTKGGGNPVGENLHSAAGPEGKVKPQANSHGFASNWAKGGNAQDVTGSAKVKGNTKGNFRRRRRNHRGYINRGDSTPKERRRKCRGRGKLLSNQTHPPRMYRCTHLRWCSQRKKSPTGEKAKRMFMQKKGLVKGLLLIDGVDVHKEEDMGMAQLDKTYAFLFKNISEFKLPHFLRTLEFIRAQKEDQFFTLNYLMPHVWEEIAFCFFTDRIHMLRETQTASSSLSLSRSKVLFAGANLNIAVAYVMRKMSFCREERTHVMWLEKGGNRKKENIDDGGNVSSGAASVCTANPSRTVIHCTFVELHFFSEYVCTFTLSCRSLSVVMQRRGEEGGRYPFADVTARNFLLAYGFFSNGKVGNSLFTQKENAYVCRRIFRKLQLRERILRLSIGETNRVKELLYVAYARGQAFSRGGKGDPAEDETEPACCVPNVRYLTLNITLVGKTEEEGVINCNILPHQILFLLNMMRKANSCGDSLSSGLRNFFKSSPKEQRNMRGIPGEKNRMNVKLNLEATNLHLKFYFLRLFLKRVTLNSCEGEGLVHLFGKKRGHPRSSTSKTADDTICSFSIDSFVLSFEDAVDSSFSKREGFIFMNDVRNFPPSIFFHLFGRMPPLYCPIASNVLRHLEVRRMEVLIKRKERTFVSIDSVTMYINDQTIERLNFVFEKGRKIFSLLSGSWGGPLGRDQNSSHCNRERSSICYLKNFEINFHKMVEVKNRKSRNSNGGKKEKKKNNFLLEDSFICASEKVQGKDHPRQDGSHTGVNPVEEGKKKLSNYLFERKIHFLKRRGGEAAKRATKDREECGTDLCTEGIPPTEQREARPTQREDPLLDVHTKMLQRLRRLRRLRGLRSDPNGETPGKFHYYNRMIHPFYFLPAQSSAAPCSYAERYEDVCKNVPFNYVECEDQLLLFLHKTIIKYMNSSGEQSVSFFLKSLSSYYISSHHLFSINKHRGRKGGGGSNGGYTIHNRVKENMTCAGENNLSNELMIANLHERETYERLERKRRRKKKSTHLEEVKTNGEEKKRKRAVPYDNASLPPARNEKHFCSNKSTAKMEGSNQSTFEFASSSHSNDESVKGKWKSASHDNVSKVNELRKKMKLFFCLPNKNETLSPFLRAKELNVVMRSHRGGKQRIDSSIGGSGSEGGEANSQGNEVGGVGEVGEVSVYLDYLILLFNKRVVDYFFYLTSKMVKYYEGRRGGVSNEDGLPPGGGSGRNGRQRISSKNVLSLAESYSQFLCSRSNFKKCTIVDDLKNGYSFNFAMNTIAVEFITRDYTSYVIFLRGVHVFLKKEEMTSLGVNVNDFCLEKIKNLNHVKVVQKLRINLCDVNLRIDRSTMQDFSLLKRFLAKKRKEKKKSEKGEREKKRGTKYSSYLYVHLLEVSPLLIKANIQGSHEMVWHCSLGSFRAVLKRLCTA
ncbi:hypothetical protein PVBG_01039 [Plasmodium vivax Brazil I]|uniref:Uncharacterized protein n=1 Tax=Plasmodium vivax (strain Brazil I) TaxID=1033975 RepID=A0A0J9SLI4_PLAV1|nr:hypothetical protein PVBG_01039 [Plasmodium vivax Brazil I]